MKLGTLVGRLRHARHELVVTRANGDEDGWCEALAHVDAVIRELEAEAPPPPRTFTPQRLIVPFPGPRSR